MSQILYLFPDTNFFIQCKDFPELNWKAFKDYAEVQLIVCRPIQREIDAQKNRGNDRVGRRARKIYTLFRDLARGVASFQSINEKTPQVKVLLEALSRPSPQLSEKLDYTKPDDELVGCLHRFKEEHPEEAVGLLTYDSGPMMTANALGLKVYPIDDSWVLPTEPNLHERETERLRQQVAELENAGPKFRIECIDSNDAVVDSLELEYLWHEPLTAEEVEELIDHLKIAFPMASDFGSAQPMVRLGTTVLDRIVESAMEYIPASEYEIQRYVHQEYPQWIDACRECLASLHEELQSRISLPSFNFIVANDGKRPGDNVLIVLECRGNFDIQPRSQRGLYSADAPKGRLPKPPKPPKGEWTPRGSQIRASSFLGFGQYLNDLGLDPLSFPSFSPGISSVPVRSVPVRDPEGIFYKPGAIGPGKQFSLECKLWRHGLGDESLEGEIVLDSTSRSASGILECIVHAENLPTQARKTVKIEVVAKSVGVMDAARDMIRQMVDRNNV